MTCIRMGNNAIVCVNPWGRLKVGNRYVWLDFHEWCGPSFYTDANMTKLYDPVDEQDPVWESFGRWLDKFQAAKAKKQARLKTPNMGIEPPYSVGSNDGLGPVERSARKMMTTEEFFAEARRLNLRVLGTPEETRAALGLKDAEIARLRAALRALVNALDSGHSLTIFDAWTGAEAALGPNVGAKLETTAAPK